MPYKPKSEDQLAREGLIPAGTYDFEITETRDKKSKKGNDMYTLIMTVWDTQGTTRTIYDYIALGNNFGERKLRHAADACGIIDIYETGNLLPSDFMGKTGKVEIEIQEGNSEYPNPKNIVKDYVKRQKKETVSTGALPKDVEGDEIPF